MGLCGHRPQVCHLLGLVIFHVCETRFSFPDYKQLPGWDTGRGHGQGIPERHAFQGQQEKGWLRVSLPLPKTPCSAPTWCGLTGANTCICLHGTGFEWREREGPCWATEAGWWPKCSAGADRATGCGSDWAWPTGCCGGGEAAAAGRVRTQPGGSRAGDRERPWGKEGRHAPHMQHWVASWVVATLVLEVAMCRM